MFKDISIENTALKYFIMENTERIVPRNEKQYFRGHELWACADLKSTENRKEDDGIL